MNKDVARAELNTDDKPAQKESWIADPADIAAEKRVTRSSKPEIVYSCGPPNLQEKDKAVVTEQVRSPFKGPLIPTPPQPSSAKEWGQVQPSAPPYSLPYTTLPQVQDLIIGSQQQQLDSDSDDEVFDSDSDEMGEDKTVIPPTFSGLPGEDGEMWLRHFQNYCLYKQYNQDKSLGLMRVLLTGTAALWLDTLKSTQAVSLKETAEAFEERYKTPEIARYKSAKEIFTRRQREDENVDDYVSIMKKLAKKIEADDKLTRYAILNGLKPLIAAYVTQQKPNTLEELLEAARMAELTVPMKSTADTSISEQLADMQAEVRRLSSKWDKLTTASVSERRSPSPSNRRVTFDISQEIRQQPQRGQQNQQQGNFRGRWSRGGFGWTRGNFGQQRGFNDRRSRQGFQSPQGMTQCQKCGRQAHTHPNYCPAINRLCNFCLKRGHFSRVCRGAAKTRTMDQLG